MPTIHSQFGQSSGSGVFVNYPRLSGFTITEHLYEGVHGSIYKARQDRLGRTVALKMLPEWPPAAEIALERFNRSAYVNAQISNPNLLTLYETGTKDGYHYAAMEYVAGQTLQRHLSSTGQMDEAFATSVGLQIARALAALHSREICHRNVKPKNIFIETDGRIRLIGLGLASCKAVFFSSQLDAHAIGTPHFMAPEMIRGCYADPRSDLYSLGVTLYLMTAGYPPYEKGVPAVVMSRHLTDEPTPLPRMRPDLSSGFVHLVQRLMAKDPANRPQSARVLVAELTALAGLAGAEDYSAAMTSKLPVIQLPVRDVKSNNTVLRVVNKWKRPLVAGVASAAIMLLALGQITSRFSQDPEEKNFRDWKWKRFCKGMRILLLKVTRIS